MKRTVKAILYSSAPRGRHAEIYDTYAYDFNTDNFEKADLWGFCEEWTEEDDLLYPDGKHYYWVGDFVLDN